MPVMTPFTESDALYATRRALMQVMVLVPVALQVIIGGTNFESLSTLSRTAVVATVLIAGIGLAASGSESGLRLLSLTYVPLLALPVLEPTSNPPWLATTTHAAYAALMLVLLLPRVIGLVAPLLAGIYLTWVWSFEPQNMFPGGLAVAGGWIQILQTSNIAFTMWLFWHPLRHRAALRDQRSRARVDVMERAEVVRQRSVLWRQAAVGLHESLLNSIRYVMRADRIDGLRLRTQLSSEAEAPEPEPLADASLRQVIDALLLDAKTWGIEANVGELPNVRFSSAVFDALRAAIGELVRNAVVHGGATSFEGRFTIENGQLVSSIRSNQVTPATIPTATGIGTSLVLQDMLPEVGGTWAMHPDGFGFEIRVPVDAGRRRPFRPFDDGRLLISTPIAGTTVVGVGYFWLLLAENRYQALAGLLGIAGVVLVVLVIVRQRRLDVLQALFVMALPAAVPWLVQRDANFCEDIQLLAPAINIAGFTIVAVSLWSPSWAGVIGYWVWGIGTLTMLPGVSAECASSLSLPLSNVMFVLPIIVFATYQSVRAYDRSRNTMTRIRDGEVRARARAAVTNEIDRTLRDEITRARSILFDLAGGAEFTPEMRRDLALLDARIRAALQVRPDEAGILARTAAFFIAEATSKGIVVRVRSLADSRDMRPIPLPLYQALLKALLDSDDAEPSVQVFTDGQREYLTLHVSEAGLAAAQLRPGSRLELDDFTLDVDELDGESPMVAIVASRALSAAPAIA